MQAQKSSKDELSFRFSKYSTHKRNRSFSGNSHRQILEKLRNKEKEAFKLNLVDTFMQAMPASTREKNGRKIRQPLMTVTPPSHFTTPKSTYNRIFPMRFHNDIVKEYHEKRENEELQHFLTLNTQLSALSSTRGPGLRR